MAKTLNSLPSEMSQMTSSECLQTSKTELKARMFSVFFHNWRNELKPACSMLCLMFKARSIMLLVKFMMSDGEMFQSLTTRSRKTLICHVDYYI